MEGITIDEKGTTRELVVGSTKLPDVDISVEVEHGGKIIAIATRKGAPFQEAMRLFIDGKPLKNVEEAIELLDTIKFALKTIDE